MATALDIEASARRAGAHRWIEQRLFEVLGRWTAVVPEPGAKALLAVHARRHAAHAELWRGCLPTLPHLDPAGLTVAPTAGLAAFIDTVADPAEARDTVEKLTGVYRVLLPRLVAAYVSRAAVASEVADGPVIRVLDLVRRDDVEDWGSGERLLQSLISSATDARRAANWQGEIESLLVEAGGLP
jgi:hypothetical protein